MIPPDRALVRRIAGRGIRASRRFSMTGSQTVPACRWAASRQTNVATSCADQQGFASAGPQATISKDLLPPSAWRRASAAGWRHSATDPPA